VPLVNQIMKAEMAKAGLAVSNHLCEHFPYSRQELHHLVRVGRIKSFGELLAKHGKGLGCDICKPVAANILASTWNDFVLKPEHASLQDSNDYFLGNIQKDGTYSVVPRMPGGEVTPDGLIAVGQVAKKYGLYTKITGGARRHVRRPRGPAAADLGRADRRRLRIRPRLRQVAAHREILRRLDLVPLRRGRQHRLRPSRWRTATRACGRRTRSSSACPAAPANAPKPRARTSA
jgi:NAD(P)H-nitrite reductase large subunit